MPIKQLEPQLWRGGLDLCRGEVRRLWRGFDAQVLVCFPTGPQQLDSIGPLLADAIRAAAGAFPGMKVSLLVVDGAFTGVSRDLSVLDAAEGWARDALRSLYTAARADVQLVLVPHEGYDGNCTPGLGSALQLIYQELEDSLVQQVLVHGGACQIPVGWCMESISRLHLAHSYQYPGRPYLALPAVGDMLDRLVLAPLGALLGRVAPCVNPALMALSSQIAVFEREVQWSEQRLRLTSPVFTALDSAADPVTVLYAVDLGPAVSPARPALHPDHEALIGAAVERLAFYQGSSKQVTAHLEPGATLAEPAPWTLDGMPALAAAAAGGEDLESQRLQLVEHQPRYAADLRQVLGGDGAALSWLQVLQHAVAHLLNTGDQRATRRCLAFCYAREVLSGTAAATSADAAVAREFFAQRGEILRLVR